MNEKEAMKFQKYALDNNLVGDNWSLEAWDDYAWVQQTPAAPRPTRPSLAEQRFFNPTIPQQSVTPAFLGGV